jgi:hypothetical protein
MFYRNWLWYWQLSGDCKSRKERERDCQKTGRKKFHIQKFSLKNLNDVEFKEQYEVKISNRLAVLENWNNSDDDDDEVDINRT